MQIYPRDSEQLRDHSGAWSPQLGPFCYWPVDKGSEGEIRITRSRSFAVIGVVAREGLSSSVGTSRRTGESIREALDIDGTLGLLCMWLCCGDCNGWGRRR